MSLISIESKNPIYENIYPIKDFLIPYRLYQLMKYHHRNIRKI
jgi:hypothetical protein